MKLDITIITNKINWTRLMYLLSLWVRHIHFHTNSWNLQLLQQSIKVRSDYKNFLHTASWYTRIFYGILSYSTHYRYLYINAASRKENPSSCVSPQNKSKIVREEKMPIFQGVTTYIYEQTNIRITSTPQVHTPNQANHNDPKIKPSES